MLILIFATAIQTSSTAVPPSPPWTAQCLNDVTRADRDYNVPLDLTDERVVAAAQERANRLWIEANDWMAKHQRLRAENDEIVTRLWAREKAGLVPEGSSRLTIQNQEDALDDHFTDQVAAYQDYPSCNLPAPVNVLTHQRASERSALLLR